MNNKMIKKSASIALAMLALGTQIPQALAAAPIAATSCNTAITSCNTAITSCNTATTSCNTATTSSKTAISSNKLAISTNTTSYGGTYNMTRYNCSTGTCIQVNTSNTNTSSNGVNYTPVSATSQEQQLLRMMNNERAAKGLSPLTLDAAVSGVASVKCQDMLANRYFAHQSPTLGSVRDMLRNAGISYRGANENIARYGSLEKAFVGLMSSVGHRNNILSKTYTTVGLSVCQDKSGNFYIVQVFISK